MSGDDRSEDVGADQPLTFEDFRRSFYYGSHADMQRDVVSAALLLLRDADGPLTVLDYEPDR